MNTVTNTDDLIDSRDVIERLDDLKAELELADADLDQTDDSLRDSQQGENYSEELEEYFALRDFASAFEDYAPDYLHGETAIRDTYFKHYAQELAEDIGAVDYNASWPSRCIDWDQAAHEFQMDYSAIEFDGQTYWVR